MIKNNLTIFGVMIVFAIGCNAKQEIDLILHNAKVYTVDSAFSIGEAIAIDNGYIVGTGTSE